MLNSFYGPHHLDEKADSRECVKNWSQGSLKRIGTDLSTNGRTPSRGIPNACDDHDTVPIQLPL